MKIHALNTTLFTYSLFAKMYIISVFLTLNVLHVSGQGDGPIVHTEHGPVQGVNIDMASGDVIQAWMRIPFAKPPVGDL